jgi:hypothetical protein
VHNLEKELRGKISMADIRERMNDVLVVTRDGKRAERRGVVGSLRELMRG